MDSCCSVCRQHGGRATMAARLSSQHGAPIQRLGRRRYPFVTISAGFWMRLRLIPTAFYPAAAAAAYQASDERVHGVGARGTARHPQGMSGHAQLQHQQNSRSVFVAVRADSDAVGVRSSGRQTTGRQSNWATANWATHFRQLGDIIGRVIKDVTRIPVWGVRRYTHLTVTLTLT